MPSALAAITDKAAWLGLIVLGVALVAIGDQIGQWRTPTPDPPAPDTVRMEREMTAEDLVAATIPDEVETFQAPDTTVTECFQMPLWMTPNTSETSKTPPKGSADSTRHSSTPSELQEPSLTRHGLNSGPRYVIIPTTDGSPRLSVGKRQVTLSGALPTGEGRTWTYDVPQPDWHAWPSLTASTTPVGLQASAEANLRWQKVTASIGYMQAAEQRGITASVSIRPFTISW